MSKAKTKKKKILIIVTASILSLILCAGIGTFIWYENSPFPTVVKMMSEAKDKDVETVLECIEPDMSNKIQLVIGKTFRERDKSMFVKLYMKMYSFILRKYIDIHLCM